MTSHADVVTAFAVALADFPVDHDRPDDAYVQKAFDTIATILYSLEYDTVNGVHNLMGIIEDAPAYSQKYGAAFPIPKRPKAFDDSIDTKEAVSLASRKAETIHRAVLKDWSTYRAATTESNKFCVAVFGRTWISSLSKGSPIHFAEATTNELLQAARKACTGLHVIDLLDLQDKMRDMHLTTDTIADYIEALKDAQNKAKRAKNPVSDEYLVMVATKAMMGSQRFPRADDDWEDLDPLNKDWATWQAIYLKADNRELL
jgi:hypothetical protein